MKDDVIRFRCNADLKARFEAVAKLERRDPADLARIIFEDYIAAKTSQLNNSPDPKPVAPIVVPGAVAPTDRRISYFKTKQLKDRAK
jgi:hypothetical protein